MPQTKQSGQEANRQGRARAKVIANRIGAKMASDSPYPRSNLCTFRGKPAGIKSASHKGASIVVLDTMIELTATKIAAFEWPKNRWRVYTIPSSNIRNVGARAIRPKGA
jgi:hypothetical protein